MKPFQHQKLKEELILKDEKDAAKELGDFVEDLQKRYDVTVIPQVITSTDTIHGIVPIAGKLNVSSNRRRKK